MNKHITDLLEKIGIVGVVVVICHIILGNTVLESSDFIDIVCSCVAAYGFYLVHNAIRRKE